MIFFRRGECFHLVECVHECESCCEFLNYCPRSFLDPKKKKEKERKSNEGEKREKKERKERNERREEC